DAIRLHSSERQRNATSNAQRSSSKKNRKSSIGLRRSENRTTSSLSTFPSSREMTSKKLSPAGQAYRSLHSKKKNPKSCCESKTNCTSGSSARAVRSPRFRAQFAEAEQV